MSKHFGGKKRYPRVEVGPLPVDLINRMLGTELEPGIVWLSAKAHQHIAEDHPEDYHVCFAALAAALTTPTFIGQAPTHRDNFEIVYRIARTDGRSVLVAIGLECNAQGNYSIKSSYLVTAERVSNRRISGTLRQVMAAIPVQND